MLRIRPVNCKGGYDYKRYLTAQLEEIHQNGNYYLEAAEFSKEEIFTQIFGGVADDLGMTGSLSKEKLETISELEFGIHDKTKSLHLKSTIVRTIRVDNHDVEVKRKDITNGYVLVDGKRHHFNPVDVIKQNIKQVDRRTAIEKVYSMDPTFSYFIMSLPEEIGRAHV